jgi:hypothetical protein
MTPPKTPKPSVICNTFAMWRQEFLLFFILTTILILEKVIFKGFAKIFRKKSESSDPFQKISEFRKGSELDFHYSTHYKWADL